MRLLNVSILFSGHAVCIIDVKSVEFEDNKEERQTLVMVGTIVSCLFILLNNI